MKQIDEAVIHRLEQIYRELTGAGPFSEDARTQDFCFHMTDWFDNLHDLNSLMQNGSLADSKPWLHVVQQFLIHASGHIAAAAKLANVKPVGFEIPESSESHSDRSVRKAS